MPIVWRQTLRSGFWLSGLLLYEDLCDRAESVDFLVASGSSAYNLGTGKTKSSAGTGAKGPLIVAADLSSLKVASYTHAFVPSLVPPLLQGSLSWILPCENDSL